MTQTALGAALMLTHLPATAHKTLTDNDAAVKVQAFHELYDVPQHHFGNTDPRFLHMDNERVALRLSLHIEEFKELLQKGFGIRAEIEFNIDEPPSVVGGKSWQTTSDIKRALDIADEVFGGFGMCRNGKEVMDALGDINYVDTGMSIEMGYDPRPVLAEIHAGNLTKLGEDGKPIINGVTEGYREGEAGFDPTARHGKVLKGPNYVEPNIPAALGWE